MNSNHDCLGAVKWMNQLSYVCPYKDHKGNSPSEDFTGSGERVPLSFSLIFNHNKFIAPTFSSQLITDSCVTHSNYKLGMYWSDYLWALRKNITFLPLIPASVHITPMAEHTVPWQYCNVKVSKAKGIGGDASLKSYRDVHDIAF